MLCCVGPCLLLPFRFDQGGGNMQVAPLSERGAGGGGRQDRRITLGQIKDEALGTSGQADWVQVRVLGGLIRFGAAFMVVFWALGGVAACDGSRQGRRILLRRFKDEVLGISRQADWVRVGVLSG